MMQILANVVAPEKSWKVTATINAMNRMNSLCQGAPQQSANGFDAVADIMHEIVTELDKEGKYKFKLRMIVPHKDRNNAMCQGADQQSANYLYRTMEMVQIVTDLIADEEDRRTELYWQEHEEERQALLEAKAKDQEEIRKIEREACAVNADAEIKPIKDEIKALEKTRDSVGAEEMAQLQKELEKVRAEYNQIGFFKFKERMAAQVKVTEAERLLNAKKGEVG